jgi:tetratricopeptide (TPR) repeat protein
MFHLGMWRERMRDSLLNVSEGRPHTPPGNSDEINDAELPNGIGTPLADAAARSDHLLAEIIGLYEKLGDRPFQWHRWTTTTDAVLGNSYTHPRLHIYQYMRENGDAERALQLLEDTAGEMREASSNPTVHATAAYNLACVRAQQGKLDDALEQLRAALEVRSDMKPNARQDSDLALLRDDPRFQELVKS